MKVIKRDGAIVPFDIEKIIVAINKAFVEVDGALYEEDTANDIAYEIGCKVANMKDCITVEEIQDLVEDYLMRSERRDVARAYIRYRYKKEVARNKRMILFRRFEKSLMHLILRIKTLMLMKHHSAAAQEKPAAQ